jgi:hypothetical protein
MQKPMRKLTDDDGWTGNVKLFVRKTTPFGPRTTVTLCPSDLANMLAQTATEHGEGAAIVRDVADRPIFRLAEYSARQRIEADRERRNRETLAHMMAKIVPAVKSVRKQIATITPISAAKSRKS